MERRFLMPEPKEIRLWAELYYLLVHTMRAKGTNISPGRPALGRGR